MTKPDQPEDGAPPVDASSTLHLVRRHQAGDADALARLLAKKQPEIRRIARAKLRGQPAARHFLDSGDVAQEIAQEVVRRADLFRPEGQGAFRAWMGTIAWRKIRDVVEKRGRRKALSIDGASEDSTHPGIGATLPAPADDPVEEAVNREILAVLAEAEARLTPLQRDVFRLRFHEGLDARETAQRLGLVSADAATEAYRRARLALAEHLQRSLGLGEGDRAAPSDS